MSNQTSAGLLTVFHGLQNVAVKVEHQHRRRTGALDKIRDMILQEEHATNAMRFR